MICVACSVVQCSVLCTVVKLFCHFLLATVLSGFFFRLMVFTGFFDSTLGIVFVNRFVNDTCFLIKIMTYGKLKTVVKGHYLDSNKQFKGGG